uniref:Leucyl/phenylalanyl-tRNA--protein transferase n=1 Tax=Thermosporothrix sp. COM3 TaxID=2490863 RepID=A0A455SRM1_9CHLR|nr:leucyl/phenylalanyl-tRNA--protein transferase [Thermosporothrix sp. COM3]
MVKDIHSHFMDRKTHLQPEPLDPQLTIAAYAQGIFPMADEDGRIQWYAPDPRAILEHENLHVSRSLRATIRKGIYEIRSDTAFTQVMRCCAMREETWINEAFIQTYTLLHRLGLAHSVEAWKDGTLVGGLYGVTLGGAFMGESMFSHATDASKVCLVALVEHLKRQGFVLHDTQFLTPHLQSLGVTEIPRKEYERRLQAALQLSCHW